MTTLFAATLILHVLFGLLGLIASFWVTFHLFGAIHNHRTLVRSSALAFISYILSWFAGGWYYWKYYGAIVKPKIVGGDYVWAHAIFMEVKEHIFLFLPFASLCIFVILWLAGDSLRDNGLLRRRVAMLSFFVTLLATIVTLSGVLITGGAR